MRLNNLKTSPRFTRQVIITTYSIIMNDLCVFFRLNDSQPAPQFDRVGMGPMQCMSMQNKVDVLNCNLFYLLNKITKIVCFEVLMDSLKIASTFGLYSDYILYIPLKNIYVQHTQTAHCLPTCVYTVWSLCVHFIIPL